MKPGLKTPAAVVAALSTKEGKKAIDTALHAQSKAIDLGFTILKIGLFSLAVYITYKKVFNSFVKAKEDKSQPASNITIAGAKQRAENLYRAMNGVGANFDKTIANLRGLNYNGFIRVFNEFGERRGYDLKKQNLTEWIFDQFNEAQIKQLRFAANNSF